MAIGKLKRHKSPGSDDLLAEVFKLGGVALTEKLTELFTLCWDKCTMLTKQKRQQVQLLKLPWHNLAVTGGKKIFLRIFLDWPAP